MTEKSKWLYGRVAKLDKLLKAAPGFCKAVMVLLIGGIAGEEHCKGREMLGYILLGCGLLVSMGGLCRDKTKKG